MDFLFPFINFLQPGIAWPDLAVYRPLQIAAVLTLIVGLSRKSMFARGLAFGHPVFKYLVAFVVVQVLSVYYSGLSSMLDEFGFWFVYLMFVVLTSPDKIRNEVALGSFATATVLDQIRRVRGVGEANMFGTEYSMRIWLDPAKLQAYGVAPSDVAAAAVFLASDAAEFFTGLEMPDDGGRTI